MKEDVHTVIIGSGISGLSCAHFLSKSDKDFLLIESQNRIGGIIKTEKINRFICENGPNTVLLNNDSIIEMIKDCGLWDSLEYPKEIADKNRFVLYKGEIKKVPTSLPKFIFSPLLTIKGKISILKDLFVRKHRENTTVYDFIVTRFGKEFHDELIEPFITGIYAGDTRRMSAQHSLKHLWRLEQNYGGVIKGFFRRKKNKNGQSSFHFPMGLTQLMDKIADPFKEKLILKCKVDQIIKKGSGYEVVTERGRVRCKEVISALPAHVLKNLVSDPKFAKVLEKVNYSPVDVFHFGFSKKNIRNQDQGFGLLTKPSNHKKYLGVLFSSRTFGHVAPKGQELFTVIVGGERQRALCNLPLDELGDIVLNEVEELLNHKGKVLLKKHFRWRKGIPQYEMNHQELVDSIKDFESSNQGFYVIGNFYGGISVSDCVHNSKKLAVKIEKSK